MLSAVVDIVKGAAVDCRWKLRCDLARHYSRHLESLDVGADGERVAAYAWWLAEFTSNLIDSFDDHSRRQCSELLVEAFRISEEVWTVARPSVSTSSLRYATLYCRSIWATAILCELSISGMLKFVDGHGDAIDILTKALSNMPYNAVVSENEEEGTYTFQGTTTLLAAELAEMRPESEKNELLQRRHAILSKTRLAGGLAACVMELPVSEQLAVDIIMHELRLQAMCGMPPSKVVFQCLSDRAWRQDVLINGTEQAVELFFSATIEMLMHEPEEDWRKYLPHFFAISCEEAQQHDKKRQLFAYTVAASLAANSVSAIERLLKGQHRRDYEEFVAKWRERIEQVTRVAPRWIAAKLRGLKCILYVG